MHVSGEQRGYVYKYNAKHPAFEAIGDQPEYSSEYLFRLLSQAIIEIDLESDTPYLFEPDARNNPAELGRKMRLLLGDWLHDYYN